MYRGMAITEYIAGLEQLGLTQQTGRGKPAEQLEGMAEYNG